MNILFFLGLQKRKIRSHTASKCESVMNSSGSNHGPVVKRSKTQPFHGCNRGSIPLGITMPTNKE